MSETEFPLAEPPRGLKERDLERIQTGAEEGGRCRGPPCPAEPEDGLPAPPPRAASPGFGRPPRGAPGGGLSGEGASGARRGAAAWGGGGPCAWARVLNEAGKGPRAAAGRPAAAPWLASEEPGCFRSPGPAFRR